MQNFTSISPHNIDDNLDLINKWATNNELIGGTDGSESDGSGGHAYGITSGTTSQIILGGYARTVGDPSTMSSLRTEHAGIISFLTLLLYLERKLAPNLTNIKVYVDNDEVLRRILLSPTKAMKEQEATDFDLWILIQKMQALITTNIQWETIKSHASINQRRKQGLLSSALNDKMDDWANLGRQIQYNPPQYFIPESRIMDKCRGNFLQSFVRPWIQ